VTAALVPNGLLHLPSSLRRPDWRRRELRFWSCGDSCDEMARRRYWCAQGTGEGDDLPETWAELWWRREPLCTA
jgi:hypothetical protein